MSMCVRVCMCVYMSTCSNVNTIIRILLEIVVVPTVQILLPIFCILTLVVCVGMSVFTHYWYPYIDEKGKKRIKTKPTEYASISGCHGNDLLTVFVTGNQNQLCGDHAQLSALDNSS